MLSQYKLYTYRATINEVNIMGTLTGTRFKLCPAALLDKPGIVSHIKTGLARI